MIVAKRLIGLRLLDLSGLLQQTANPKHRFLRKLVRREGNLCRDLAVGLSPNLGEPPRTTNTVIFPPHFATHPPIPHNA